MPSRLVLLALLFQTALGITAPLPPAAHNEPAPADDNRPETIFAQQLFGVTNEVVGLYVRPVSRSDLLYAALSGLYEAARLPQPDHLQRDLETAANDQALLDLIRRAREEAGSAELLQGRNPLVVCCQALTRTLDPYSGVVTGEEQRRTLGLEAEGLGVGLEVAEHNGVGPLRVKAVYPGSPAQKAGLKPDDRITHLDGRSVREWTDDQVVERLNQGPFPGDQLDAAVPRTPPLALTYERPGQPRQTILTLVSECYRVENVLGVTRQDDHSWDYWVDRKQQRAHIRLASLGRGSARELAEVVGRLHDEGLRGLILDLRWCPGGYLDEAVEAACLFLRDGIVATVKTRTRKDQAYPCKQPSSLVDFALVVLVNGETSGGAEMVAACLQDHKRAVVCGQRTLGKASVQTPIHLGLGTVGMKLTSGTFVRPSGKNLHRFPDSKDSDDWGVTPDPGLDSRISADLGKQLKQWWMLQTLRPGGSMERLPLDDPSADPQRQAALEALRELLLRCGPGFETGEKDSVLGVQK